MDSDTQQTSSDGSTSTDPASSKSDMEEGSESGWRDESVSRPIFIMGDDDPAKYSGLPGFQRNLEGQKIQVGICAMSKKTNSKPMKEILGRLERFEHLQIIVFGEEMIVSAPVDEWPVVDALVSFFSYGFPLQKAIQYKNLRKPFVVNDLEAQYALKDRREVYKILVREGIAHPRYGVMNRDCEEKGIFVHCVNSHIVMYNHEPSDILGEFEENEDAIGVNGMQFQRPFVEKPVDAEDHNIYIYFPPSAGGGCQRLFRKVGSRSSVYSTVNRVRKTGSYIYEDFMPTDGTDVKVYTVGPDYAHAEARKSPALDGKVERDKDGKEIRYPVLLSAAEKMIARKVCLAFKQNVCGFDLLRTSGKSYVCDVNGFSFVKNSTKYYDDCANVIGTMIVRALAPQLHIPLVLGAAPEDIPVVPTTSGSMMELRCVVAVIRHGDRTPKQKMKMEVKHRKFFELFEKYNGYKKGHLKLKKPKQLQEVLDIARDLLNESQHDINPEVQEKKDKLRQLKLVLEMYGHFSGINRKVQLKYQPQGAPRQMSCEEGTPIECFPPSTPVECLQPNEVPKEPSLVLIVKWGGELTPAGKFQAEDLGKAFRTLYPGGQGEFETPGLGFLRLHSTFRHDLKIYASDEGRVQMTAAAFTKGLLALEGELTPILVSMVKSANTNGLLDKEGETSKYQHIVKERLMDILNQDRDLTEEDYEKLVPTRSESLVKAVDWIKNPRQMCKRVFDMVKELTARIKTLKQELKSRDLKLYHGESWELLIRRWGKLEKDLKMKTGDFDISKIPDIYDCIKYDLQHNQKTLQFDRAEELFIASKALADIVIPQEYGITIEEKLHISQSICTPLMRKIRSDLFQGCQGSDEESTRLNSKYWKGVPLPEMFVRTRLYFTSESHIHSLLTMLRYGGLCELKDEQWKKAMDFLSNTPELNYMTQINIMMYEDPTKDVSSPERFHVELHFSPGAYTSSDTNVVIPSSSGYRTSFLARQSKKGKDNGKKLQEGDKTKPGETSKKVLNDIIKESITEESLMEKSSTSDIDVFESANSGTDGQTVDATESTDIKLDRTAVPGLKSNVVIRLNSDSVSSGSNLESLIEVADENSPEKERDAGVAGVSEAETKLETSAKRGNADTGHQDTAKNTAESIDYKTKMTVEVIKDTVEDTTKNIAESIDDKTKMVVEVIKDTVEDTTKNVAESAADKGKVAVEETEDARTVEARGVVKIEAKVEGEDTAAVVDPGHIDVMLGGDEEEKKVQVEAETMVESESSAEGKMKSVPQPRSPDPNIPEWDWDEVASHKADQSSDTVADQSTDTVVDHGADDAEKGEESSPTAVSEPISIVQSSPNKERKRTGSFDDSVKSYEDKRSRSLEEKEDTDSYLALIEQHYRTIHLPINKDSHHSFSSLLYLNPDAFKDESVKPPVPRSQLGSSYSEPTLSHMEDKVTAFDGFNMVPSLKPLETLHNNLTMRDMDRFFCRALTSRFFTPASSPMYSTTPLPSPRGGEVIVQKAKSTGGPSLPSSSSSSAGPSSPSSMCNPTDFMNKLKLYIIDHSKNYTAQPDTDSESQKSTSSYASANQKQDNISAIPRQDSSSSNQKVDTAGVSNQKQEHSSHATPASKSPIPPQETTNQASKQPDQSQGASGTSQSSASKSVQRSSSNRSAMFQVTQVSEDSHKLENSQRPESKSKADDASQKNQGS